MDKNKFFIGIGPSKTGSTWLYHILSSHPESKMPFEKELRYFYSLEFLGKVNVFTNLFSKEWSFVQRRKRCFPVLKKELKNTLTFQATNWKKFRWYLKYFCLPQNDEWYKSQFPKNKLSGDISPHYVLLSEKTIVKIRRLNANTKIIIGLRNPVDRIWSIARVKYLKKEARKKFKYVDKNDFFGFCRSNRGMLLSNNYTKLIKKWQKHFPKEQILIYYFDELQEDPQKLFNKICQFLEIEPIEIDGINKKVNKGIVEEIPAEYEKELIRLNYKYIEDFAKEYPNEYSLAWLERVAKKTTTY